MLFAVYIRVSRKLQAGTRQILLGQNVFPLESLKPGNLMALRQDRRFAVIQTSV